MRIISNLNATISKIEQIISNAIFRTMYPDLCVVDSTIKPNNNFKIQDIWKDGFLWAVPKHRRSVERRHERKFGHPLYFWKPYRPKTDLLMCKVCGHFHEAKTICGHCYEKVKLETQEIQKEMEKTFKLDPIKDDIVVLYEDEEKYKSDKFWKNQRIIEMPKKRPSWFHNNLLESTSQKLSDGKEVKPDNLS